MKNKVIIIILLSVCSMSAETFREWLYRRMGLDPRVFQRQVATLSEEGRTHGALVMQANTDGSSEAVLWECGDCWSLTMGPDGPIVARQDGIWSVEKKKLLLPFSEVREIIGTANPARELLVLANTASNRRCKLGVYSANLALGKLLPLKQEYSGCPELDASIIRRDRVRGSLLLSNTQRQGIAGPALELRVTDLSGSTPQTRPLFDELARKVPARDRFDPIWSAGGTVVYLADR